MTAFKIDENLPIEVRDLLRSHSFDATTVGDQGLGGRPDADVAAVCRAEKRAIVTFDLDFADTMRHPPASYAGIVVLRLTRQDKPFVLDVIAAVIPHFTKTAIPGQPWIVEDARIRIRE